MYMENLYVYKNKCNISKSWMFTLHYKAKRQHHDLHHVRSPPCTDLKIFLYLFISLFKYVKISLYVDRLTFVLSMQSMTTFNNFCWLYFYIQGDVTLLNTSWDHLTAKDCMCDVEFVSFSVSLWVGERVNAGSWAFFTSVTSSVTSLYCIFIFLCLLSYVLIIFV